MRIAACALATSSRCSESVSAAIRVFSASTSSRTAAIAAARCWRSAASASRVRDASRDHPVSRGGNLAAGLGDRGGHRRGMLTRGARPLRAHPRLAFGGGRAAQRIRPSANGIRAFLGGAHRQPGLHLGGAGGLGGRGDPLRGRPVRLVDVGRRLLRVAAAGSRVRRVRRRSARGRPPARRAGASAGATRPRRPGLPARAGRAARRSPRSRRRIR